jgi:MATE family multidrug resistance protein
MLRKRCHEFPELRAGPQKVQPMSNLDMPSDGPHAELRTSSCAVEARVTRRGAWPLEARALLRLAAPLVASQLAQMGLLTTDVLMLGRLSAHALAAAAIGNTVYYFAWLLGLGPASAVAPMVSHILGVRPRDRAGVRGVARMGLWAVGLGSAPLMLILLSARPILIHLGQDPGLSADAGRFVAMLCIGLPFALGFQVLRNFTTALHRPSAARRNGRRSGCSRPGCSSRPTAPSPPAPRSAGAVRW